MSPFKVSKPDSAKVETQSAKPISEKVELTSPALAKGQQPSKPPKKPSSLKGNISQQTNDKVQDPKAASSVDTKDASTKVTSTVKPGPLKTKANVDTASNSQPVVSQSPTGPPSKKAQCVCVLPMSGC